jgi:predicted RNA-binding Zn-ribbon protein involved in translation (DUF1610 family)
MERKNPMKRDGAKSILQMDKNEYKVIMENGKEFKVSENECSCGHSYDYTPSMSTSFEQSYQERRSESCQHRIAVLNSEDLGSCPECGGYQVTEEKMNHQGRHVMSRYRCTGCGKKLK